MSPYQRTPSWIDCFTGFKNQGIEFNEIIDVGAAPHASSFTSEIVKLYPNAKYNLIEPQIRYNQDLTKMFEHTEHVIYNNIVGKIEQDVYEVALKRFENQGATHVLVTAEPHNIGWSNFLNAEVLDCQNKKQYTLDSLLVTDNLRDSLLCKIDVDGQDLDVLIGASNTLKKTKMLQVEASLRSMTKIINFLELRNFVLVDLVDFCYYNHALTQVDLIFIEKDFLATLSMYDQPLNRNNNHWNNELLFNYPYMMNHST